MEGYSPNNPSVKRILQEMKEMQRDQSPEYAARAMEDNLFEWHFTVRGPAGTPFEGGIYHGRILLPAEYPFKPPNFIFLTPNGRFDVGTKICLTISAHHPEHWQPSWSIRTALVAMIGFFPTPGEGAIGALDYSPEERRALAQKSVHFCCPKCGPIAGILPPLPASTTTTTTTTPGDAERQSADDSQDPRAPEPERPEAGGPHVEGGGEALAFQQPQQQQQQEPAARAPAAPPQVQQQAAPQGQGEEPEGAAQWLNRIIIALIFAIAALLIKRLTAN